MKQVLVIHGPNLNLLGTRETHIYGKETLDEINNKLIKEGKNIGIEILTFFSNHEGEIVDFIQNKGEHAEGLIINPAAYTHTSIAIRDAILARELLTIEIHLSNIYKRDSFRQHSYFHDISEGVIMGLGPYGYHLALKAMDQLLNRPSS
ncbi:MAG TPA: type II 3-dehydroquinate dehydratase [Spirochaetes bacterium]|nr:type II 3-dehydroquinate dehydratase [Spirochaetota bacterium]